MRVNRTNINSTGGTSSRDVQETMRDHDRRRTDQAEESWQGQLENRLDAEVKETKTDVEESQSETGTD